MDREARRERNVARIREDILKAAARAMARRGIEGATVHDIAGEAGYTAQSLYAYFDGKQAIVTALCEQVAGAFRAAFDEGPSPSGTFSDRLAGVLRRQLAAAENWREALPVFFELTSVMSRGASRPAVPSDPSLELLSAWIAQNARPEEIGHRPPSEVARVLAGIAWGVLCDWYEGGQQGGLVERASLVLDYFQLGLEGLAKRDAPRAQARVAGRRAGRARARRAEERPR